MISLIYLPGCKQSFEPISYGHDACVQCKMTIMDKRFAAEIVTSKGKVYKFDDIGCLLKYATGQISRDTGALILVSDYNNPENQFINAYRAVYLHNEIFKSPMNGNYAAFATVENTGQLKDSLHTELLKWENLHK
ncbi:nitrous oxide reductase accessory protein NosL [Chitinophaga sp. CF118]|uniref:nitrous oxide reductase accessory protein NosL n=1 Tax=Chitinophaga sp. CF118 TaxID=1884367 RepID=UPI0021014759|nr:nitrous oxide reductase accessory protein NosL [Chitinophaga sp. CF118]